MIEILAPGPRATLQDLGRSGYAGLGVPRSGAFDRSALRRANRQVGNDEGAAAIEFTFGGLSVRLVHAATLALTGAACPGAPGWDAAVTMAAGTELHLGRPERGLRSYLAVRGGFEAGAVLGSLSTDSLSGLGPPPLRAGAVVPIARRVAGEVSGVPAVNRALGAPVLGVRFGPRDDWFTPAARDVLIRTGWTVGADADRVGIRLAGPRLERTRAGELPSEATRPGALQVPGDGRPILFGPDAPVTGGYPVIAVVLDADLDRAAQLRPGDIVRFADRPDPGLR